MMSPRNRSCTKWSSGTEEEEAPSTVPVVYDLTDHDYQLDAFMDVHMTPPRSPSPECLDAISPSLIHNFDESDNGLLAAKRFKALITPEIDPSLDVDDRPMEQKLQLGRRRKNPLPSGHISKYFNSLSSKTATKVINDEKIVLDIPKPMVSSFPKSLRFNVDASYILNTAIGPKINSITCKPGVVQMPMSELPEVPTRDSVSSGNLGDISQATSTAGGSPVPQLQPPPSWAARSSEISTSSSGSSIPPSASALARQQIQKTEHKACGGLSSERIAELKRKWQNSDLIYNILDYIDQLVCLDQLKERQNDDTQSSEAKKQLPITHDQNNVSYKKRIRSFHINPNICSPIIGKEVFAKSLDGYYYYGLVGGMTKMGQLDIDFSANNHLCIDLEDTITCVSSLISHTVMVFNDGTKTFYPGIVSDYFTDSFPCKFCVISDFDDIIVTGNDIYLTEEQGFMVLDSTISSTNDDLAMSGPSGFILNDGEIQFVEPDDPYQPTDMGIYKYVTGCEVEASNSGVLQSLLKLKGIAGKVPKRCNQREDAILGPLTVSGNWFKGLNFILTCSMQNLLAEDTNNVEKEEEGSDTNNTDSEDYVFSKVPYVSDRLAQQIKLGGGRVLTTLEELEATLYTQTYLVTNRPCLTARFLRCLAMGITIACHEWIINCTARQKKLVVQELPAGWSIENGAFVTMYQRKVPRPLLGMRIQLVQNKDPHFINYWNEICKTMGSNTIISRRLDRSSTVVVVEDGYQCLIVDEAQAFEIPVVSASWIAQTLLHGEMRSYTGHVSYDHMYEESWEY